jgi:hypothetical protein
VSLIRAIFPMLTESMWNFNICDMIARDSVSSSDIGLRFIDSPSVVVGVVMAVTPLLWSA